ncbi:hypothetical protein R84981_002439 [Carnimonas sp. R-84981]
MIQKRNRYMSAMSILVGEGVVVFAEMSAANELRISQKEMLEVFCFYLPLITIGGMLVIVGYVLGVKGFGNVWDVVVVSVASMLFIEPVIAYSLFRTLPEFGALVGMIMSFAGCFYTLKED